MSLQWPYIFFLFVWVFYHAERKKTSLLYPLWRKVASVGKSHLGMIGKNLFIGLHLR